MQAADIRARLSAEWHPGGHVDLRGITCEGALDLAGCAVAGVDFTGARFPQGLDARGARFLGLSWFGGAQFDGTADFSDAVFTNDARFEGARFNTRARFNQTEFRGIGRFDGAVFAGDADFSDTVAYGNFSLQQVRMTGSASFHGSEWLGGLWCQDATLPPRDRSGRNPSARAALAARGASGRGAVADRRFRHVLRLYLPLITSVPRTSRDSLTLRKFRARRPSVRPRSDAPARWRRQRRWRGR